MVYRASKKNIYDFEFYTKKVGIKTKSLHESPFFHCCRHPPLQNVADFGRHVLYRLHPEPVRHSPRQILGHHRPHQLRPKANGQKSPPDDSRGVGHIVADMLAAAHRLERLARTGRVPAEAGVQTHRTPRLRHILLSGVVLHTPLHHDHSLRGDIHSYKEEVERKSPSLQNKYIQEPMHVREQGQPAG